MEEFEKKKRELLQPILFEAGAALQTCQGFEYGIALLLFHFSRLKMINLTPDQMIDIIEDRKKTTAGQLIGILKSQLELSEEIKDKIQLALSARNKIVHRFLIDNVEHFVTPDGREKVLSELKGLRKKVIEGDKAIQPFVFHFNDKLDGVVQEELEAEIKEKFLGKTD